MYIGNCGKKIKEIAKQLGDKYVIKLFDLEWCIYRDFGNGYDVEISGLNNRRKDRNATVYVWSLKERVCVVETIKVLDLEELKTTLEHVEYKYLIEKKEVLVANYKKQQEPDYASHMKFNREGI